MEIKEGLQEKKLQLCTGDVEFTCAGFVKPRTQPSAGITERKKRNFLTVMVKKMNQEIM